MFRCPTHRKKKPIYYVSRALADAETRYSKIEQTTLALRSAAQKLFPYFQAHSVVILTDQPLRNILHKPDLSGRMLQWAIELSEYGIEYQPRLSMKGQVMVDFVVESPLQPAKLHEGVCGNHSEGRSLAHRAHSQGHYWPTMKKNVAAYVKKCDKCQRHAPIPHMPSETLNPIISPWPFAQ